MPFSSTPSEQPVDFSSQPASSERGNPLLIRLHELVKNDLMATVLQPVVEACLALIDSDLSQFYDARIACFQEKFAPRRLEIIYFLQFARFFYYYPDLLTKKNLTAILAHPLSTKLIFTLALLSRQQPLRVIPQALFDMLLLTDEEPQLKRLYQAILVNVFLNTNRFQQVFSATEDIEDEDEQKQQRKIRIDIIVLLDLLGAKLPSDTDPIFRQPDLCSMRQILLILAELSHTFKLGITIELHQAIIYHREPANLAAALSAARDDGFFSGALRQDPVFISTFLKHLVSATFAPCLYMRVKLLWQNGCFDKATLGLTAKLPKNEEINEGLARLANATILQHDVFEKFCLIVQYTQTDLVLLQHLLAQLEDTIVFSNGNETCFLNRNVFFALCTNMIEHGNVGLLSHFVDRLFATNTLTTETFTWALQLTAIVSQVALNYLAQFIKFSNPLDPLRLVTMITDNPMLVILLFAQIRNEVQQRFLATVSKSDLRQHFVNNTVTTFAAVKDKKSALVIDPQRLFLPFQNNIPRQPNPLSVGERFWIYQHTATQKQQDPEHKPIVQASLKS